jgi:hypothetical protein
VIRLIDLFNDPSRRRYAAIPEMDALEESDALVEAELSDIRIDVSKGDVGLILDLRGALHFRAGNSGLLIVREVTTAVWNHNPGQGRMASIIVGSVPANALNAFSLDIELLPSGTVSLVGSEAEYYVGNIPGLPAKAPDYADDSLEAVLAAIPSWTSTFEPVHAAFSRLSEEDDVGD